LVKEVRAKHLTRVLLISLALLALLLSASARPQHAEAATSASASVTPNSQGLGDSTLFNFTVYNTGTTTIYGVEVVPDLSISALPLPQWWLRFFPGQIGISCTAAPPGWSVITLPDRCLFLTTNFFGGIAPGQSLSGFQVRLTAPAGTIDSAGSWRVLVDGYLFSGFTLAGEISPGSLALQRHSWEILDAVVASAPATVNTPCPPPNKSAPVGTTQVIVICGRNATTSDLTPAVGFSSLAGTFLQSSGTFSSGLVTANSAGSVVLANWTGAVVTSSIGTGKTVVASIGSAANQTSGTTTLNGYEAFNTPPVANPEGADVNEDGPAQVINVLSNDTDAELDPLHVASVDTSGDPLPDGNVTITNAGADITYDPNGQFESLAVNETATDTFTYKANDTHSDSNAASVAVTVHGANDAPTNIALSNSSVTENQAAGTDVGTLSSADVDTSDTHSYSLVAGTGDTDNGSFSIAGNVLKTGAIFDFETKSSYSVRIQTDDGHSGVFAKAFTITIADANDAPTDIALSNSSVAENQPSGTNVGTLSTTDQDAGDTHTYSLVAGTGDDDNGSFSIAGNVLKTGATFDFETKSSYKVRIQTDDGHSGTFAKAFTITITNVNEAPTGIALDNASVDENAANTTVGGLTTTEPDTGQTHTYSLPGSGFGPDCPLASYPHNASFQISGSNLQTGAAGLDYEAGATRTVCIRTTDNGAPPLSYDKQFTITVNNLNEAPTNITLSGTSQDENTPTPTTIGTLGATDQDVGDTFSFSLVSTGPCPGPDNGSLQISGTALQNAVVFNYEVKPSYTICVRVTDNGIPNLSFDKQFTITVNNVNEAPAIAYAGSNPFDALEKQDTAVTGLSVSDPDSGALDIELTLAATHGVLTLRTDVGGGIGVGDVTGNGSKSVTVNASQAEINATFGAANGLVYHGDDVAVNTADVLQIGLDDLGNTGSGGNQTDSASVNINLIANRPPTDVALDNASQDENTPTGTNIGTLSTNDPDVGDTFVYSLPASGFANPGCPAASYPDNTSFQIGSGGNADKLQNAVVFNYEVKSSYTICVRTTDQGGTGFSYDKEFTITVNDVNEAPTDITLSGTSQDENTPTPTTIGTLGADDPDTGDTFAFSLPASGFVNPACPAASYPDNASFSISGTALRNAVVFNYEVKSSYTICVRVTDNGTPNLSLDKQFTITINNVNDAPVVTTSGGSVTFTEGDAPVVLDSGVGVTDEDGGNLASASVSITTGCNSAQDVLALASPPIGITVGAYVPATCTLPLSGAVSAATYQTALRAVTYNNTNVEDPGTTARVVTFSVDDGAALNHIGSNTRNLTVVAVNDPPVNNGVPGPLATNKNTNLPITGLSVSDVDAESGSLTTTLNVLRGKLTVSGGSAGISGSNSSTVTLTGTVAAITSTLGSSVTYIPPTDYVGPDTFWITTNDNGHTGTGGSLKDEDLVEITVNGTQDVINQLWYTILDVPGPGAGCPSCDPRRVGGHLNTDGNAITPAGPFLNAAGVVTGFNIAVDQAAGYFFVGNSDCLTISSYRISDNSLAETLQVGDTNGAGTLDDDLVCAVAVDPNNHVLYVNRWDFSDTGIVRITYNPANGDLNNNGAFNSGSQDFLLKNGTTGGGGHPYTNATNFEIDLANHKLYYTDWDNKYDDVTFDPTNGIFVVDYNAANPQPTMLTSQVQFPTDASNGFLGNIAVDDAKGLIYFTTLDYSDPGQGHVWYMPIAGGTATKIMDLDNLHLGDSVPAGLTLDPVKQQLYINTAWFDPVAPGPYPNAPTANANHILVYQLSADGHSFVGGVPVASYTMTQIEGQDPTDTGSHPGGSTFDQIPIVTTVPARGSFSGSAITLAPSIAVTDADNGYLAKATVTIAHGGFTGDVLAANTTGTSITASFSAGVLTLSGYDTVAHYQQVLRTVTYSSSSGDPTNSGVNPVRGIDFLVSDGAPNISFGTTNSGSIDVAVQ
jgi:VCBS repeat-containing protein